MLGLRIGLDVLYFGEIVKLSLGGEEWGRGPGLRLPVSMRHLIRQLPIALDDRTRYLQGTAGILQFHVFALCSFSANSKSIYPSFSHPRLHTRNKSNSSSRETRLLFLDSFSRCAHCRSVCAISRCQSQGNEHFSFLLCFFLTVCPRLSLKPPCQCMRRKKTKHRIPPRRRR
jgi:hypothetical protein